MDEEIDSKFILFSPWTFIFLLLILILGNLFIVDVALFWKKNTTTVEKQLASTNTKIAQITPTTVPSQTCGTECKAEIQKAVANVIVPSQTTNSTSSVKEYFITLGSGGSTSTEWADVPGIQGYIDSTSYGRIKSVSFEASLYTPTNNQEAEARLFNVTDSHPVWNSDVKISGGTAQLKISSPITLDKGSKLYQVQMRTQLGSRTNLENARIHIVTY